MSTGRGSVLLSPARVSVRDPGRRQVVSDDWYQAHIKERHPLVVTLIVEPAGYRDEPCQEFYLCGECRSLLARRPTGAPLGQARLHCPTCGSLNER